MIVEEKIHTQSLPSLEEHYFSSNVLRFKTAPLKSKDIGRKTHKLVSSKKFALARIALAKILFSRKADDTEKQAKPITLRTLAEYLLRYEHAKIKGQKLGLIEPELKNTLQNQLQGNSSR